MYNHRDKQGRNLLVKKAREVFRILDRKLFTARVSGNKIKASRGGSRAAAAEACSRAYQRDIL